MTLAGHAEVLKLARLLETPAERLGYLEALPPEDVRLLRERAADSLYAADGHRFHRVALASRLPPVALTTFIAEHAFGPLLCARVAGLLDTRLAVEIAMRLPTPFVADLAALLDPRRAKDLIAALPPHRIAEVAAELTVREEYIAMGRFVGFMTDAAIEAAFGVIDDASLLRISYFVEAKDHLDHVVGLLAEDRVRGAIRAATAADLWPQALDLLTRVSPGRAGSLADLAALEDDDVLDGMVATAQRDGLWDAVLPVTRQMSPAGRTRFASLTSLHDPEVLGAIVRAAAADDLWHDLLPLAGLLPRGARGVVWSEILAVAGELPVGRLRTMAAEALDLGVEAMILDLVDHLLRSSGLLTRGLRLVAGLGPVLQERLVPLAAGLPEDRRAAVLHRVRALRLVRRLGPVTDALAGSPPA
ncbi:MAG: hypothetical protein QOE27_230 [Solirubrobacteraceae bacterium]|nr:hypothetical protein [Solirubrobacteraceae bacterium]